MNYTPRTCPGPGDLWQMSWQEENGKLSMSAWLRISLRNTFLATATSGSTNLPKRVRMNDILRLSLCLMSI
nr:MAG TPA: acyl-protein synthetase [Caudoviricetes sp.]